MVVQLNPRMGNLRYRGPAVRLYSDFGLIFDLRRFDTPNPHILQGSKQYSTANSKLMYQSRNDGSQDYVANRASFFVDETKLIVC